MPENEIKKAAQQAELIIESFNLMGYDALGIGDDDLTLGKEFLLGISKKAKFPFLSSNLMDTDTGKPLFPPYVIKEVSHLRVGIFSLLSPEFTAGPQDPRFKGLTLQNPFESAQKWVKELQPKTDLIILLSHLGYAKDVEMAMTGQGIHLIVGAHSGVHLVNPPLLKNTVILQTSAKGMYVGRLDLIIRNNDSPYYNGVTKSSLESNLGRLKLRLSSKETPEAEKTQLEKTEKEIEQSLAKLQGQNEFNNNLLPLTEMMRDHPEIQKRIEAFKSQFKSTEPPASTK